MFSEHIVQRKLVVDLPGRQTAQNENTQHAEVTAWKLPDPSGADGDGSLKNLAAGRLIACLGVVDPARGRVNGARTQLDTTANSNTFNDHASRATKASSSMKTGAACGGSSTPLIPTPPGPRTACSSRIEQVDRGSDLRPRLIIVRVQGRPPLPQIVYDGVDQTLVRDLADRIALVAKRSTIGIAAQELHELA